MNKRLYILLCIASMLLFFCGETAALDNTPVTLDDRYSTVINDTLTVAAPGVLNNDFNGKNEPLNAVKINEPANGSVTLNTDGSFTYIPVEDFKGKDSFTYEANDGYTQSYKATVTIYIDTDTTTFEDGRIGKTNAVPVASGDTLIVKEEKMYNEPAPGILSNDRDPDTGAHPLTADLVRDVSHGALSLNADGSFDYTPEKNFFGTDRFTYRPYDGAYYGSETAVEITVNNINDRPVVVNEAFSTCFNTTVQGNLLDNDYDPDEDRIKISSVTDDSTAQGGTITIDTAGSFTYNPPEAFTGTDQYNYIVSDIGSPSLSASGTVFIAVTDTMVLNPTVTHNTCHGDIAGSIDLEVRDSTPRKQALAFNGTNDDIIISDDASLNMSEAITLEAWIRITGPAGNNRQVMGKNEQYHLRYNNNELIFYAGKTALIDTINIMDSVWYHLAATYNRDTMKLYVNGAEVAKKPNDIAIQNEGSREFHIAQDGFGKRHFEGMMDEVRIWSVARSGQQIRDNMIKELNGKEDGLEGYWKFNKGSGFAAYDSSPNDNDGALSLPDWVNEYSYTWRGADGSFPVQEQEDISNLKAGAYTCMVTGGNGCPARITVPVREPKQLMLSEVESAHQNVTCNGENNGSLEVNPEGGWGSYEFSIDSGETWVTDSVFTGLAAGDYTVYLRDANNPACRYTGLETITITEPPALSMNEVADAHQDVTCNGGSNGQLEVDPLGGSGSYAFSIDSGETWVTDSVFTGLAAGDYTVYLRDANDPACRYTGLETITITEPPALSMTEVADAHQDVTCNGGSNGLLEVDPLGGSGSYAFSIDSGGTWVSDSVFTGLSAGDYTVYLRDSNDTTCQYTGLGSITITEPTPLSMTEIDSAHQNVTSYRGADGTFEVDPSGGSGNYEFSIDSGSTWVSDSTFTALTAGNYTVYLRDANDTTCQFTGLGTISLTQPNPFSHCDSLQENNYCYRFWDESYDKIDSIPVRYEWSFSDGTKINGLKVQHCFPGAGKYSVKLNIIDNRTGNIFFTQKHYEFEIKDVVQPYIRSKDAFVEKEEMEFDGLKSNLPGFQIENYFWDFGDDTITKGPKVQHQYKKKGNYRVKLGLTGINDTTESKEYHCVWKEIKVFEDYQELAMHQENEEEKDSAIEPEEDPNNELQTEFNAYNRNPKEAIFRVEVFSSEEKVSLQDSIFDPLRDTYEISEFYDESDSLYSYTVGKRESLSATYPVYNDVVDRGFEQARVKSYIIGELPEKVVDHIKKAFNKIDNGHFGFDEYRVLESSYPVLDRIARILKHNPDIKIEIAAHTDNIGSFGYNMKLSKKRAQSIVDYMVSKGISKDRLRAVGYGESRPIATNQTKSGRQKNRRVEFILIRK